MNHRDLPKRARTTSLTNYGIMSEFVFLFFLFQTVSPSSLLLFTPFSTYKNCPHRLHTTPLATNSFLYHFLASALSITFQTTYQHAQIHTPAPDHLSTPSPITPCSLIMPWTFVQTFRRSTVGMCPPAGMSTHTCMLYRTALASGVSHSHDPSIIFSIPLF
jgi:hypothetical protein